MLTWHSAMTQSTRSISSSSEPPTSKRSAIADCVTPQRRRPTTPNVQQGWSRAGAAGLEPGARDEWTLAPLDVGGKLDLFSWTRHDIMQPKRLWVGVHTGIPRYTFNMEFLQVR